MKRASGHQWKQIKYSVIVAHKGKNNALFGTVNGLFLFVCTHNIKKTLCFSKIKKANRMQSISLEQEHFTKMNQNSVNNFLTDMMNISIEIFELLQNEIILKHLT